jgi:hypothetical protein
MQRLDAFKFAIAGSIYGGACIALATILALLGVPGFRPFTGLRAIPATGLRCGLRS